MSNDKVAASLHPQIPKNHGGLGYDPSKALQQMSPDDPKAAPHEQFEEND